MSVRRPVTVFDAAVAAVVLAAFFLPLRNRLSPPRTESHAVIATGGKRRVESLHPDRRVEIPGPLGLTVIEIAGNRVRVAASPCPNQLCVRSGFAGGPGRAVVCAPNGVAAFVEGGEIGDEEDGIDGIAR